MLSPRWIYALLVTIIPFSALVAAPVSPEQKKLADLRLLAVGDDRPAAYKAMMELTANGDPARPTLVAALRTVLTRDHGSIEENLRKITALGDLKAVETAVSTQQAAALAKIEKLATAADTNAARGEYAKLAAAVKRLNDMYAPRAQLLDIMQTRLALLALWKDVGSKTTPNPIDFNAESQLTSRVEQALAPYATAIKSLQTNPSAWSNPEPGGAEQAGLLTYRLRRRADVYNRGQAPLQDRNEAELLAQINTYRDVLGLPPLELDARLVQAARRHSKEMVEQKYFSNTSPVEQNKDPIARRRNAGYDSGGFWSEAMGRGTTTGVQTFWAMFDQPPYHKGMTEINATAIGIGKWNTYWTVEIGGGPRLMLAREEDREKVTVAGEVVGPQTPAAAAAGSHGTARAGDSGGGPITDPRQIKPRAPNGAGSVPGIPALPGIGGF